MNEHVAIMQTVAKHLTGRDVVIRFEDPETDLPANAALYKDLQGNARLEEKQPQHNQEECIT